MLVQNLYTFIFLERYFFINLIYRRSGQGEVRYLDKLVGESIEKSNGAALVKNVLCLVDAVRTYFINMKQPFHPAFQPSF